MSRLNNENGQWEYEERKIYNIVLSYFSDLFKANAIKCFSDFLQDVPPVVDATINEKLCRPFSDEEIKSATFEMGPLKAPGPYGFQRLFYQKYWKIIGEDLCSAVRSIFNN